MGIVVEIIVAYFKKLRICVGCNKKGCLTWDFLNKKNEFKSTKPTD